MFVWQLHQVNSNNSKVRRTQRIQDRKTCYRAPGKQRASSFTPSPCWWTPSLMKPLTCLVLPPHRTEASLENVGHWGIARAAVKLKLITEHSSIREKTPSLPLALCQLPLEKEDVSEKVVRASLRALGAGFHRPASGLLSLLSHLLWHAKMLQDWKANVLPLSLPVALSAASVGFATCTCFLPLPVWNPERREQAVPKLRSWNRSQRAAFSHHRTKLSIKSQILAAVNT